MEKAVTALLRAASERGLESLLIGGNALILLGYIRNTVDLDLLLPEEARSRWFDLMFVDEATRQKLSEGAKEMDLAGEPVLLPRPEYLVALKLHAAASATRSKPEVDWEDIRQIVRLCELKPEEEPFRSLILRYGGEDALRRIQQFRV